MKYRAVVRVITDLLCTPVQIFESLRGDGWCAMLESARGGRYSYLFGPPVESATAHLDRPTDESDIDSIDNPWYSLQALLDHHVDPHPELRNFYGGAVGYLSYDLARSIERLPATTDDDMHVADVSFMRVDRFIEFDHREEVARIVALVHADAPDPGNLLDGIESRVRSSPSRVDAPLAASVSDGAVWSSNLSRDEFEGLVRRARQYIYDGDLFQVNLSIRCDTPYSGDPFNVYRHLRELNPSPYMAYLEHDDLAVASASPELLLRVAGGTIQTRPIAGTRPRGTTVHDDERMEAELAGNEKERAEHLMLVDLERNDIGRVAEYGTVCVDEFMAIEHYSHVIHIVSNVRGKLAAGKTCIDAIKALFPGGTITGAPKVRAMQVIDELEPTRRGLYTGSIGWMGFNGDCELNIVIRTVIMKNARAYVQAGAGIVADSDPESEYRESIRKAQAGIESVVASHSAVGTREVMSP